jgi:DNA-binding transcriptional LysR family regulator
MIDPQWLESFVRVAETKSFTAAARLIGVSQSTVSSQIQRLEKAISRHLLARDTHAVMLTPDGDALIAFAREVLNASARLERFLAGSELRGSIRLGASEDFALAELTSVLANFSQKHNSVDVELTIGLSEPLYRRFDAGELDVLFVKRRDGDLRGQMAWREQLAWIGKPGVRPDPNEPLPLVVFPPPSITRAKALAALERAGRSWRIACTSGSLNGIHAATRAGLGFGVHSSRLIPPGLVRLPFSDNLPELDDIEFVALGPGGANRGATALIEAMLAVTPPPAPPFDE